MSDTAGISPLADDAHSWHLPTQPSIREVVTGRVRRAILEQELRPGSRLRQTQLADALGVSRMPVRDAIQELVAEGLLHPLPHGGVVVPPFDLADILSALTLWGPLEQEAVRAVAAHHLDDEELLEMHSGDSGLDFHRSLVRAAGNRFLTSALTPVWAQAERVTHVAAIGACDPGSPEHVTIVRALATGDAATASRTLRSHLDAVRDEVAGWAEGRGSLAS